MQIKFGALSPPLHDEIYLTSRVKCVILYTRCMDAEVGSIPANVIAAVWGGRGNRGKYHTYPC